MMSKTVSVMGTVKMATADISNEAIPIPKAVKSIIGIDTETAGYLAAFFTVSGNAQQNIDYYISESRAIDGTVATITSRTTKGGLWFQMNKLVI